MMNPIIYALEAAADTPFKDTVGATLGERAGVAGSVSLLGIVAVFAVLALLWGVIELLHRALSHGKPAEQKPAAPAPARQEKRQVAPVKKAKKAAPKAEAAVTAPNDDALIAVITAAVAAAMAEEGYTGGFRVVSFHRAQTRRGGRT